MKLVRVISGVYGWLDPATNRRVAKTPNDAPFLETDIKAARFIKARVLEYAPTDNNEQIIDNRYGGEKPYNADMKFNNLKKVAAEVFGIDVAFGTKKADLLALLDGQWAARTDNNEQITDNRYGDDDDVDGEDDGEDDGAGGEGFSPPTFGALPPISG
jgi:hypothetical protein